MVASVVVEVTAAQTSSVPSLTATTTRPFPPSDTDVLMTHMPPHAIRDKVGLKHWGSRSLRERASRGVSCGVVWCGVVSRARLSTPGPSFPRTTDTMKTTRPILHTAPPIERTARPILSTFNAVRFCGRCIRMCTCSATCTRATARKWWVVLCLSTPQASP